MLPHFQGRETEHNWNPREKSVIHMRGMLRGQAFEQFPEAFVSGLKHGFFEGLSKTVRFLVVLMCSYLDCQLENDGISAILCFDAGASRSSWKCLRPICRECLAYSLQDGVSPS